MPTPTLLSLSCLFIPLFFVGWIYAKWVGSRFELAYATLRMMVQLIAIGYVLVFIFTYQKIWLGGIILGVMLTVSTTIIFRNTNDKRAANFALIFVAIFLAVSINLGLIIAVVLHIEPLYQPQYIIPLAGMVLLASMTGFSLMLERFEDELQRNDFITARNIAFKVSMIPQINSLLAVGIVALPGMMTGQILSGIDPLIAVRYQIMIMIMSVNSAGMSIIFYFWLKPSDTTKQTIQQ